MRLFLLNVSPIQHPECSHPNKLSSSGFDSGSFQSNSVTQRYINFVFKLPQYNTEPLANVILNLFQDLLIRTHAYLPFALKQFNQLLSCYVCITSFALTHNLNVFQLNFPVGPKLRLGPLTYEGRSSNWTLV